MLVPQPSGQLYDGVTERTTLYDGATERTTL